MLANSWIPRLRRLAVGSALLALAAGGTTLPARAAADPGDPTVVVRRIFVDNGTASQGNMLVLRDGDGWEYWMAPVEPEKPAWP